MENFENSKTIYQPEKKDIGNRISLSPEQKNVINGITLGIEEVDETIRQLATEDVVKTLENGHPLNRLIEDKSGNISGFIACEDFIPHEAYIKYFGAKENLNRNLFKEIPAFFEYAKQQGYAKLNFHGWNEKLNRALEHFGFEKIKTDRMNGFSADFYEKTLMDRKTTEAISEERKKAFERKYINKIKKEYEQTLKTFSRKDREQKEKLILENFQELKNKLINASDFEFKERQEVILKLKLARYFQNSEQIDASTLYDAIIESPKFIGTDKGSLHKLFEVHEQKTLEKIAEIRKRRAEIGHNEKFNPYESLLTTESGKYYLARLLNMPHLEEESEYMRHCVGTSDSYINKIKRGEIEILSFRHIPKFNQKIKKFDVDKPIMTIEYNLKTKEVEQMKKADDEYLNPNDPYFEDVIDALKKMRQTKTDAGGKREIKKISKSELNDIEVKDYHLLTENGEVNFHDFDPDKNIFILKRGKMEITPDISQEDAVKIMLIVEDIKIKPDELARKPENINEKTKAYIGKLSPNIFELIQKYNIEHIYTEFSEGKIQKWEMELGGKNKEEIIDELEKRKNAEGDEKIYVSDYAESMLKNPEFFTEGKREQSQFVKIKVRDLGFPNGATTQEIYEKSEKFGLELCPPETGPTIRLNYEKIFGKVQPRGEYFWIAMKQIADSHGYPNVFNVHRHNAGASWLHVTWAKPSNKWNAYNEFVFRLRKLET